VFGIAKEFKQQIYTYSAPRSFRGVFSSSISSRSFFSGGDGLIADSIRISPGS